MIYFLSTLITISLVYTHKQVLNYTHSLLNHILQANSPDIKSKLISMNMHTLTIKATKHHMAWTLLWSPLSIITIIQLAIFSSSPLTDITFDWLQYSIPFSIATTLTPLITYKPIWLDGWIKHIVISSQLHQLDTLTNELQLVKQQLTNLINKQITLTDNEILELHTKAKLLISLSQILNKQIQFNSNNL